MESLAFYIFLFVHLASLVLAFGAVLVVDTFGLLWLLKFKKVTLRLVTQVAEVTQMLIWLGFCGLVFSGIFLILMKGYVDNLTKIKLFFVLLIGLNGIFLHYVKKSVLNTVDKNEVSKQIKFRMGLATSISQLGWWGALSIGFVHRHWRHNIPWPEHYVWIIVGIILTIGSVALVGETLFRKQRV